MKQATEFIWSQVDTILEECRKYNISVPPDTDIALSTFISELFNWTDKMNLISKNDLSYVGRRHILDSLSPFIFFSPKKGASLLDIGSGAGFPAIPMKLFRPDLTMALVESRRKKVLFLKSLVAALGLTDFEPIWERVELLEGKEAFDLVTSRATAVPEKIAKWAHPHLKPGGKLILFIGPSEVQRMSYIKRYFDKAGYSIIMRKDCPFVHERDFQILIAQKPEVSKDPYGSTLY